MPAPADPPPPSAAPTKLRVMFVEDDREVFDVVERALRQAGYEVCEQVQSGEAAPVAVEHAKPDLLLMDIQLGGTIDGITAAQRVRQCAYEGPLIYFTAHADDENLQRARETRPEAFLLKPVTPRQLLATVGVAVARSREERQMRMELHRARAALTQVWEVTRAQLSDEREARPERDATFSLQQRLRKLSRREREVFELAVRGEPVEQLARTLFISPHTARNHLAAIYRKLGVGSRLELSTTYLPLVSEPDGTERE